MKSESAWSGAWRESLIMTLVGSLFISGVLWMVFYGAILSPQFARIDQRLQDLSKGVTTTIVVPGIEVVPVASRPLLSALPKALTQKTFDTGVIYRKTKESEQLGRYESSQISGIALAATSDGWFFTTISAFEDTSLSSIVVGYRGGVYPVKNAWHDKVTNLVYFQTDIRNATPIETVRPALIEKGATGYIEYRPGVFLPTSIVELSVYSGIIMTDKPNRRMRLAFTSDVDIAGSPVRDADGRIVGIVDRFDTQQSLWLMMPVANVISDLSIVSKEGVLRRPSLTLKGYDLSHSFTTTTADQRGFVLTAPVARQLAIGDRIERIDRDLLTGERDLGEILLDYRPGATVTLYGFRNTEPFEAQLVLNSTTATEVLK